MALNFETQRLREELKISERKLNKVFGLLIASQKEPDMDSAAYRDKKLNEKYKQINNPQRPTEGQLLGKEGGYLKDPETEEDISKPLQIKGMPPAIDPEEHKRLQKQKKIRGIAEEGATEGERQAGRGKLKDQTQLPNFLKIVIDSKPNPANLLKILQFLPAFTGGGLGQMADASAGSKILNELPRGGWPARNSHRGLVEQDKLLDTIRRATKAFKA
tara:strand:+ start:144 stop:794 length:651 start_codon:yes stop_codon:yes gene_type:complete